VDDISVSYEEHGQGEPLLLIYGFAGGSLAWRPEVVASLARSFRVITFDNRGTGHSDTPETPYTLARMADDAAGLLDALGIARAHVFGISMGGMIAQELALRHPKKVHGLVLGCTNVGAPVSASAAPEVLALLLPPPDADPREAARKAWASSYTPEFIERERAFLEGHLERIFSAPTPPHTRQRHAEAVGGWSSHERLGEITTPTLILTGDRDVLVPPENSRILHERITGSRLATITGAAHNFPNSHPAETARLVSEFLIALAPAATVSGPA
jgi:pimeloyl-ACP methyl ester carboxylesterase